MFEIPEVGVGIIIGPPVIGCNSGGCEFELRLLWGGGAIKEVWRTGGPVAEGLPGGSIDKGDALDVRRGGEPPLEPCIIWFCCLILFSIDLAAACVFRPLVDKVGAPVVLGDICFCFDLGLGCVTNDGAVVDIRLVALVEELVAGKRVGWALEICVLPIGACEG